MKKTFLALGAAVVAITGSAAIVHAQQGGAPSGTGPGMGMHRMMHDPFGDATITRAEAQAKAAEMFAVHDVNRDGKLDPADRAARMNQRFDTMDTNRDGALSREEFAAAHAGSKAGHDGAGHKAMGDKGMGHKGMGHGRMGHKGMGGMMMMGMDANGDRTITRDEFVNGALKHFDTADANRDGKLTSEERRSAMQAHRREMRERMHGGMNKDAGAGTAGHDHGAMTGGN